MAGTQVVPWADVPTASAETIEEEYEAALGWLKTGGLNPLLFDFSGACWPGMNVTKVYMPQLTYAHVPSHPYLGHPRYYEVPQEMGAASRRLDITDLIADPLPFP